MDNTQTVQEYWKGFPESPATDTIKWLDKDGFDHFTTLRGWTPSGLRKAVTEFIEGVIAEGGHPLNSQAQASPPKQEAKNVPAPAASTYSGVQTMHIVKMAVEPRPDGKIKLGFFTEGHKYADLTMVRDLDGTLKALAGTGLEWTAENVNKVTEYDVQFLADWRNSDKLNSAGNPYKNIVNLRPLDGMAEEEIPY